MILVKSVSSAAQADLYSYGALAGKAVLFFPGGITLVMFPRVSALRAEGKPTKHILAWSLAACLAMEGAVVGFYALFPAFTSSDRPATTSPYTPPLPCAVSPKSTECDVWSM